METSIRFLGHACFLIEHAKTKIVIDPYEGYAFPDFDISLEKYKDILKDVDYVISSHKHADHYYISDKLYPKAKYISGDEKIGKRDILKPGEIEISYLKVDHGPGRGKCAGILLKLNNKKIYHFGDTYRIEEGDIKKLIDEKIDIALIPIGGTYTLDPKEATEILLKIKPKKVIPMHYRTDKNKIVPYTIEDFLKNKEKLKNAGIEIISLREGEVVEL